MLRNLIGLAMAAALFSGSAAAQTFPSKPITLVVPFTAGAANDVLARTLAGEMRDTLGAVIVENKPGANGNIGAEFVKRSAPDGHTLLVVNDSYLILAAMSPNLPYSMLRDFEPVIYANRLPFFLVVNQEAIPVNSLKEFVEFVRARPGKLSYGSAGNGTPHHLSAELLKLQAGLDATHVPYKGMAQGLPDLLSGRIQFIITGLPAVASHLKTGKLRVLATVGSARTTLMPDMPTFAEAGVSGVEMDVWMGVAAPTGTPKAVISRINAEFNRVLNIPAVREKLASQGIDAAGGTPEELGARMRADLAAYTRVVKAANIRPD
jgi:tripartite-type tricarboxylate transporter receptor subunit TctC